jgi:hypothetical protein
MPIIQTPVGMLPFQVDDFGKDCERSCKGALYLRPSATRRVTQAELDHLLVKYAEAKTFVVIPDPPKKKADVVKTKPGTLSRGRRGRRGDG